MYGMLQAYITLHTSLKEDLIIYGYESTPIMMGLCRNKCNGINLNIGVENSGIKYIREKYA